MIDAHCHIQDSRFKGGVEAALARARDAGVGRVVCNGTRESDWPLVAALAEANPMVTPCFGLHPWYVGERSPEWLTKLRSFLSSWPQAGCGEIGLDHGLPDRNDAEQRSVFVDQLALATELKRPVVVHCRRGWIGRLEKGAMQPAYLNCDIAMPILYPSADAFQSSRIS